MENIPQLSNEERVFCDGEILEEECHECLLTCKNNKSPGNDGLTKEFYEIFWKILCKPLLDCYRYSLEVGELSNSQRQAIITLLEKKGKDRSYLVNWRPISLLNFDYKLLTKVLANRVKKVIPSIISSSQTAYVRDRSITDSVKLVQDIIHLLDLQKSPGLLLLADFQKAFDSINWKYVIDILERFNFGPTFVRWVEIIYTNISSCVTNNGRSSHYFGLHRGVRQGNPLSPYIFIIAVEILALVINQNRKIRGVKVNSKEIKMTQYADDLTLILSDLKSLQEVLHVLRMFGQCSGLMMNKEKTEAMLLGQWRNVQNSQYDINWTNGPIKLLGVYLSRNLKECVILNFQSKINALLRQLHWWKARDLSLTGRVLIVKALALSKFQYLASLVNIPENIIEQVNRIVYEFIWSGKTDKVKRILFEQNYNKGGYKMAIILIVTQTIFYTFM